ncbi:pilus assembly protein PilP [bacterium]|nr:pilus assembly protein PilP [bacterium]
MGRRQDRSKRMFALLLVLFGIYAGLRAYIRSRHTGNNEATIRTAIDNGVEKAKRQKPLSGEEEALLRIQLALVDYIANFGSPPDTLSLLIPRYFDALPSNPRTGKPFTYQKTGTFYSLNIDSTDPKLAIKTQSPTNQGQQTAGAEILSGDTIDLSKVEFINPNTMELEDFVYDPTGKRDPFEPFDFSRRLDEEGKTPLERYELGQLRLTAVLGDTGGSPRAIVEDESGRGYTVGTGAKIGKSGGTIVSIEKDRIKILETKVDFAGQETQNIKEMKLYKGGSSSR